jgi:hypothetical protein
LISAIKYLRKEREENKSSKKELMKGVQGSEQVSKNLRAQLEEARRIEETLEYQKKCLEASIAAQKEDAEKRENISQHSSTKGRCGKERKHIDGLSQGKNQ